MADRVEVVVAASQLGFELADPALQQSDLFGQREEGGPGSPRNEPATRSLLTLATDSHLEGISPSTTDGVDAARRGSGSDGWPAPMEYPAPHPRPDDRLEPAGATQTGPATVSTGRWGRPPRSVNDEEAARELSRAPRRVVPRPRSLASRPRDVQAARPFLPAARPLPSLLSRPVSIAVEVLLALAVIVPSWLIASGGHVSRPAWTGSAAPVVGRLLVDVGSLQLHPADSGLIANLRRDEGQAAQLPEPGTGAARRDWDSALSDLRAVASGSVPIDSAAGTKDLTAAQEELQYLGEQLRAD